MPKTLPRWRSAAMLPLLMLVGCAAVSPPQPPVIAPGLRLDPLPASVTQIDSNLSAPWQEKVQNYLLRLEDFSSSATSK